MAGKSIIWNKSDITQVFFTLLREKIIFTQTNYIRSYRAALNFIFMIRKFTILFLLCIGVHSIVQAQVLDSVTIYTPYGTDTTCPGVQLTFTAVQSNDTFTTTSY